MLPRTKSAQHSIFWTETEKGVAKSSRKPIKTCTSNAFRANSADNSAHISLNGNQQAQSSPGKYAIIGTKSIRIYFRT